MTGLQMRRAAELYAGSAKTDPKDAWVLADYARRHADQLVWLDIHDELLGKLRILNGRDVDLATDVNRISNRCRDALVSVSPALERVLGPKLDAGGVREATRLRNQPEEHLGSGDAQPKQLRRCAGLSLVVGRFVTRRVMNL